MRKLILLMALALLAGCDSGTGPADGCFMRDTFIAGRAERVSVRRLMEDMGAITAIPSRYMHYDEGCERTVDLLRASLEETGAEVHLDSVTFFRNGRWVRSANVRAELPGRVHPERVVLVGAHWDSVDWPESGTDSTARAAGAVDNATGVASLLELARLAADAPLANTLRIVLFAGEEIGFKGSRPVAAWWDQETGPDSLIAMVNVDMIGYDADAPDMDLLCLGETVPLAAEALPLAAALAEPVRLDTLEWANPFNSPGSDHYWFWLEGLPALWLTEGLDDGFPGANSDADSLAMVQPEILEAGTRALVAVALRLAEPLLLYAR